MAVMGPLILRSVVGGRKPRQQSLPTALHALVPHAFAVTQLYQSSWLAQSFTPSVQPEARSVVHVADAFDPRHPHW
jgi:hypothetical protein